MLVEAESPRQHGRPDHKGGRAAQVLGKLVAAMVQN
jgi:hypothetical protein